MLCLQTNSMLAQDSTQVLTLDDCIRIGLDQSTQILLSKDSVRITGAALLGAYGTFCPTWPLTAITVIAAVKIC